ncbi:MAG: orotate phosphoribosyltransferase [bacterium]|nr:orotate phosphoribosyltransferase [bacterium]
MTKKELVMSLYKIGAIKFGKFTFKSGIVSPNYVDLRVLVSYPKVLSEVGKSYVPLLKKLSFDRMAGIPYAALPIIAAVGFHNHKPWMYTRKEAKNYGTKKLIEGEYKKGDKVVLIDDVITTGLSKIEVLKPLESEGLKIKDIVVYIDREQGGREELEAKGYRLHSVVRLSEVFKLLHQEGILSDTQLQENLNSLKTRKSL